MWFGAFFIQLFDGIEFQMNEWLSKTAVCIPSVAWKNRGWVIKNIQSQAPGSLLSQRHYTEWGIRDKMWLKKSVYVFFLSSSGDVVLTTNMTPPRGHWMCTRAYRVKQAGMTAFPLANRVLGLQCALSAHAGDGQWSSSLSPWFCSQMAVESVEQKHGVEWFSILFFLH